MTPRESADIYEPWEDEPLPPDFSGSYIWYRFFATSGKRSFKLRNAREDITEAELKAVADYILENNILLNSKGDPLQYCVRATVARTYSEDIPIG